MEITDFENLFQKIRFNNENIEKEIDNLRNHINQGNSKLENIKLKIDSYFEKKSKELEKIIEKFKEKTLNEIEINYEQALNYINKKFAEEILLKVLVGNLVALGENNSEIIKNIEFKEIQINSLYNKLLENETIKNYNKNYLDEVKELLVKLEKIKDNEELMQSINFLYNKLREFNFEIESQKNIKKEIDNLKEEIKRNNVEISKNIDNIKNSLSKKLEEVTKDIHNFNKEYFEFKNLFSTFEKKILNNEQKYFKKEDFDYFGNPDITTLNLSILNATTPNVGKNPECLKVTQKLFSENELKISKYLQGDIVIKNDYTKNESKFVKKLYDVLPEKTSDNIDGELIQLLIYVSQNSKNELLRVLSENPAKKINEIDKFLKYAYSSLIISFSDISELNSYRVSLDKFSKNLNFLNIFLAIINYLLKLKPNMLEFLKNYYENSKLNFEDKRNIIEWLNNARKSKLKLETGKKSALTQSMVSFYYHIYYSKSD